MADAEAVWAWRMVGLGAFRWFLLCLLSGALSLLLFVLAALCCPRPRPPSPAASYTARSLPTSGPPDRLGTQLRTGF